MQLIVVVGARANVVKVAPLLPALSSAKIGVRIAFAGGKRDALDCGIGFVSVFGVIIPAPTWYVDTGSGTNATTTGVAMRSFERLFAAQHPDAVLVCGDVNATFAAAISAAKAGIPVIHLEAGIRCGDLGVADEINRVLISRVAAMHLTPTALALENLEDEGIDPERIHFVGNTVAEQALRELDAAPGNGVVESFGLTRRGYVLAVFHRPDDLADAAWLAGVLDGISASTLPVLMPDAEAFVEAATTAGLEMPSVIQTRSALPHLKMLSLIRGAACVVTDSGGVQEEACVLCTPCVTVRHCTEHVDTVSTGANVLVQPESGAIGAAIGKAVGKRCTWAQPVRWDSAVSDRVARAIRRGVAPLR